MAGNAFTANVDLVHAAMNNRGVCAAQVASASCRLRLSGSHAGVPRTLQRARFNVQATRNPHRSEGERQNPSAPDALIFISKPRRQQA